MSNNNLNSKEHAILFGFTVWFVIWVVGGFMYIKHQEYKLLTAPAIHQER